MGRVISTALQFIDGFTKPSKKAIDSMNKMAGNIKKTAREIQNAGKAISSVGSTMTKAITVPITGVATAAVKTAADFESAMSEVGAISGTIGEDMAKLTAKAKEMGATTAFSASESAEAMKYMAMAGWKTADMTEGIAGIMNLAAASGEDLAATSDIVTDGLTAFGMAAKESGRFADVMAATSSNANTNVALMGETFKYCASTAGAMGYSIEDISVAIGIMGNAGIKGSMAGTTLKNTIANLAKPTDAQAAVMEKLGISLTDSGGNMKSFAEVMNNLRSSFSGLSETEKAAAATTLAGKQSMAGLLTIVNASTEDFDKLTAAINGSSGSAGEMAAKMLDNLNGQLTLLKSAAEGILITVGDKLLPHIKKAVSWFQTEAEYINGLSDAQVDNIVKWAGIAAAIGPALLIFGKMVTAVGNVQKTFAGAIKIFAKFKGLAGLITSPAGIVIGVLAAIALAAVLVIKNWDKIKPAVMKVKDAFMNVMPVVKQTISNAVAAATPIIQRLISTLMKILPKAINTAGRVAAAIIPVIKTVVNTIKTIVPVIVRTFVGVAQKLTPVVKTIGTIVKAVVPVVGKLFAAAFTFAGSAITKVMPYINKIAKTISSVLVFAVKKAGPVIQKMAETFGTVFHSIFGIVSKVANKLKPVFHGIGTIVKAVMAVVKTNITISFGIAANAIGNAASNIKQMIGGVIRVFGGILDFVSGVFTGNWRKAWEGVKSIFKGIFDTFAAICKTPINAVIGIINGAISGLNKINVSIPDWVPALGGKSFGINIPTIPQLYKGTDNWRGGMAMIHDRGGEIVDLPQGSRVYPHDKSVEMARREGERSRSGSIVINIKKLADKIEVRSDEDIDRIAEELAYKLKEIALNTGVA